MEIPNAPQNIQPYPKKRPSDSNANFQDSSYFKIRAVIKDLRPHFLEVLRTPDFRTSKAASEISQRMKVLMKLYEEMTSDTITLEKCKTPANNGIDQKKAADVKPVETPQQQPPPPPPPPLEKERISVRKPSEERPAPEKHLFEDVSQGSHIVGGSAFGWNFVAYSTNKPAAYYGRTKDDFRAANPIKPNVEVSD